MIEDARDDVKAGDVFYYADEFNLSWFPTDAGRCGARHEDDEVEAVVRAAAGRLVLLYLPTYSPWLNPIEMLWRHFRREVTRYVNSLKRLKHCLRVLQPLQPVPTKNLVSYRLQCRRSCLIVLSPRFGMVS